LFVYPFAGRHAHLGIASLLAYRIGQGTPSTFSIAINDYGFELLSPVDIDWMGAWRAATRRCSPTTDCSKTCWRA
jgi:ATP-dependent helicase Lhr and Lhr-like helicase